MNAAIRGGVFIFVVAEFHNVDRFLEFRWQSKRNTRSLRPTSTQTRKNGALGTRYSRADDGARSRHGRRDDEFGRDYAGTETALNNRTRYHH